MGLVNHAIDVGNVQRGYVTEADLSEAAQKIAGRIKAQAKV